VHYTTDLIAIPRKLKTFLFLHGYPELLNDVNRLTLFHLPNLISVSEKIKYEWSQLLRVNESSISNAYNGIDTSKFYPEQTPKIYDFLYIGRLIEIKGVQDIIHAVEKLVNSGMAVKVAIAGTGPFEESLKQMVSDCKIPVTIVSSQISICVSPPLFLASIIFIWILS
jgi:glycosyltransferase involved in cell wall biosynthesis